MNKLKDWKRQIPTQDFANFVAEPIAVEPGKRTFADTKDSKSETGHRLITKVRMTFAGLPTGNRAIYLPDEMYKGVSTWNSPFNKPVQKHHDDMKDPIGRVIDAKYVDTLRSAAQMDARAFKAMEPFKDKQSKKKAKLESVQIFQDLTDSNPKYMGVGHILGLWDITSPEDIKKVQDGRLLTVSTAFTPEGAHCSQCAREGTLTDWRYDDCDHYRGEVVDGYEVLAVPYGFDYNEVSFVNDPAAKHARVLEHGDDLSFADAFNKDAPPMPREIILDPVIVFNDKAYRLTDSQEVDIPKKLSPDNSDFSRGKSKKFKDNSNSESDSQRTNMNKFAELIKDTASNYEAIAKHLAEGESRLTGDLLSELEDSVFIGPNRTFPVKDKAHAEAIKALLETIEDSEPKTDLLETLEDALAKLEKVTEDTPEEPVEEDAKKEPAKEEDSSEEAPEAPAATKVEIEKDRLEALEAAESKVADLEASRAILKDRVSTLKANLEALEAENARLLKDKKEILANQLVDAQLKKGFTVNDRNEKVEHYMKRSLQSIKDQLEDLKGMKAEEDGMAREPAGDKVDNPLDPEKDSQDKSDEKKATGDSVKKYQAIFDRYFDLKFGPRGQVAADSYLSEQKRLGYLPANINP